MTTRTSHHRNRNLPDIDQGGMLRRENLRRPRSLRYLVLEVGCKSRGSHFQSNRGLQNIQGRSCRANFVVDKPIRSCSLRRCHNLRELGRREERKVGEFRPRKLLLEKRIFSNDPLERMVVRKHFDGGSSSLLVVVVPPWHSDNPNSSNWPVGINSKNGNRVVGWVGVGGLVVGSDGDFVGDLVGSGLMNVGSEFGGLLVGARVGILIAVTWTSRSSSNKLSACSDATYPTNLYIF